MRGPGQAENPQYGVKVDNKYDAIADSDDPFEALERLDIEPGAKKDAAGDKTKKPTDKAGGAAKKATDGKKDTTSKPLSANAKQDAAKKPVGATAQEKPKTAGDKPRGDNAQQGQRRPRGGAAPRGGAFPQQAGVVGLTTAVPAEPGQPQAVGGDDEHAAANADGFQQPRVASSNYRGRRGGPRGAPYAGPPSAGATGGFRRPYRGAYGGQQRFPAAPAGGEDAGATQAAGGALNESGENEERLERNFERRGGPRPFGGPRGGTGFRRGGFRRGPAPPGAGYFEDGTGRKREYERHSGSDVTGLRPVDKREGSGSHNWGTARDDLAGQTEAIAETEQTEDGEKRASGEGALKEAKAGEAWTDLVNADESAKAADGEGGTGEQDKVYVLDDWKAREEKDRFRVPEFNVRKPNEGVDATSKWGGFVLKKRDEEEEEAGDEEEVVDDDDQQGDDGDDMKRKGKQRLNIPVKFSDPGYRGRGGRGGRGGPFERRDGGEQRGGYDHAPRGGFDRPPRGGYDRPPRGGYDRPQRGGFRGDRAPGSGAGAPQLTMDEFPSLNKQAA